MQLATVDFRDRMDDVKRLVEEYDHPMMPVFQAVADGLKVVDIGKTFALAGLNSQGLPRLAFSRTREAGYFYDGENHIFTRQQESIEERMLAGQIQSFGNFDFRLAVIRFASDCIPPIPVRSRKQDYGAACPPIPKNVVARKQKGDLYCWEVDEWAETPAPQYGDPVLLRPLHGKHYAVIAEWDLTDLERELFGAL